MHQISKRAESLVVVRNREILVEESNERRSRLEHMLFEVKHDAAERFKDRNSGPRRLSRW